MTCLTSLVRGLLEISPASRNQQNLLDSIYNIYSDVSKNTKIKKTYSVEKNTRVQSEKGSYLQSVAFDFSTKAEVPKDFFLVTT